MISVCIPIYNQNVVSLVDSLLAQLNDCNIPFEIVVIDDASSEKNKIANRDLFQKKGVVYQELDKNVGRSRIRNLLADKAVFEYLLFLDGDSEVISDAYIKNYLPPIEVNEKVICGGSIYPLKKPGKNKILRWKNGHFNEYKPASLRMLNPGASFMTNNFAINKQVFNTIRFDENLTKYGHEDTLFGYQLTLKNIYPYHIENPVLNKDLDDNLIFIEKTKQALENLSVLYQKMSDKKSFAKQVQLLNFYHHFKFKKGLSLLFPLINFKFKVLIKLGIVNLFFFKLFKISYFAKIEQQKR